MAHKAEKAPTTPNTAIAMVIVETVDLLIIHPQEKSGGPELTKQATKAPATPNTAIVMVIAETADLLILHL